MQPPEPSTSALAGGPGLSAQEARVLGSLLEKQRTTPDMYPLTLNGLRLACNQSTNRHPVVEYDEAVLRNALHHLERRGFVRLASGRGSRAPKYRHLLAEALPLTQDEHAILCVLLLRGAQTPGELKQRTERMHLFSGLDAVHDTLERLAGRGLVVSLKRRPGQKEERYAQLLEEPESPEGSNGGELESAHAVHGSHAQSRDEWVASDLRPAQPDAGLTPPADLLAAFAGLQERVARLERELAELRAALDAPTGTDGSALRARTGSGVGVPEQPAEDWS